MVSQDKCSCSMIYYLFTKKEIGAIDMVNGRIKIKKKKRITEQLETLLFMKRRLQGDLTA